MPKNNYQANQRLILRNIPQSPSVAVVVMIGTGSRYEVPEFGGISHFLEHMVFKGTPTRPSTLEISSLVDSVGGEFNAFTSKEYTGFYIKVAAKDILLAIDLLSDILFNSKFEQEEIDRERGVILEEMNMYLDSPQDRVGEIYEGLLYPDHPLGREVIGTKESLHNIQRQHIVEYCRKWYTPSNLVVGVVGAFDQAEINSQINAAFFDRPHSETDSYLPVKFEQSKPAITVFKKDTDQTHLVLGVRSFAISDQRRFALTLINTILGGNMSSRLFTQIRERRGLAYAVHTSSDHYLDAGSFNCQVGLDHSRVEETIKVILEQFALIRDEQVGSDELARAKSFIRGKLALSLEDPLGLALYLTRQQLLLGEVKTVEQYLAEIDKVTVADIQKVSQQLFADSQLNLALIGPKANAESLKPLLEL